MIDIQEILKTLPHRYPMLLVDRVLEVQPGVSARGLKNVTVNEAFFQGHYPGLPIMPGVLIVEAMAQVGAVLLLAGPQHRGMTPLIGAIDDVKFRKAVVPGDQLITDIEVVWIRGTIGKCKAVGRVNGEVVASMEMTFKMKEKDAE